MVEEKSSNQSLAKKINKLEEEKRNFEVLKSEDGAPELISYLSKNGNPNVNLNGEANNKTGKNEGKVFCGDLSTSFLDFQKDKNTKHLYHEAHSTKENLEKLPLLLESKFYKTPLNRSEKKEIPIAIFPLNHIGDQIHEIAKTLKKEEPKLLFFHSTNHAMAIVIEQKANGSYIVKFYDPNCTNSHLRIVCANLNAIKYIKIDHLLISKQIDEYFPDYKSGVFCLPGPALGFKQDLPLPTVTSKFMEANGTIINEAELLNKFFLYKIEKSEERSLGELILSILNKEGENNEKKLEMLSIKVESIDGKFLNVSVSGLSMLMWNKCVNFVRIYVESILSSNLPKKDKLALLAAKTNYNSSAIYEASQRNRLADYAAEAYIECILKSELSPKEQIEALIPEPWPSQNYYKVKNYVKNLLSNFEAKKIEEFPNPESLVYIAKTIGNDKFLKLARRKLAKDQLQNSIDRIEAYVSATEGNQQIFAELTTNLNNIAIDKNDFEYQITTIFYELERHTPKEKISEMIDLLKLRSILEKELGYKLISQKKILAASKGSSSINTAASFFGETTNHAKPPVIIHPTHCKTSGQILPINSDESVIFGG